MLQKSVLALAIAMMSSSGALAMGKGVRSAPEIDGPAGMAAMVLLVCAGMLAYNRLRK